MWPCIVTNFFIIKPTRCTNFTKLFWHETVHVSGSSSVHHQEFIHCTFSNGICHTAGPGWVPSWSCSKAVYKPVWHIPLLNVQRINSWWWTEELSETCRFSCQNNFVKLMHLFGFIIKKLREHSGERPVTECCIWEYLLFIARVIWNVCKYMHFRQKRRDFVINPGGTYH
jgi:hypothetical protein